MDTRTHYDLLIDEGNDPYRDPPPLREYMDGWDGSAFLDALPLSPRTTVLEIGVGTGRLADRVAPKCARLTGIDISPKTIERAKENLAAHPNIELICGDFLLHSFDCPFDVIYSSLTLMHFEDKGQFLRRASSLLRPGGTLILSLDKHHGQILDMGTRQLRIYPDTPERLIPHLGSLRLENTIETAFAHILVLKNSL